MFPRNLLHLIWLQQMEVKLMMVMYHTQVLPMLMGMTTCSIKITIMVTCIRKAIPPINKQVQVRIQTATGYPTSEYFDQTNYWNDGSGGGYALRYATYSSSDTNSIPLTSNAATSSYTYQQECNQWSSNYGASVPNGNYNYTPGLGDTVASIVPAVTYHFQSVSGGSLYASTQRPPPGTTSWRRDLGSSTLSSSQACNDAVSRLPHGGWEEKASTEQHYQLNQIPPDFQKASDSKLPLYENNDGSE